jgi:hypothetical protein
VSNSPTNYIDPSGLEPISELGGARSSGFDPASEGIRQYYKTNRDFYNDHFSSDEAGRKILQHYLTGKGQQLTADNRFWADYMKANINLKADLKNRLYLKAQELCLQDRRSRVESVDEKFHQEVKNGEGINGYEYLHGTNEIVGGFKIFGYAKIDKESDCGCTIKFILTFNWNDVIDPNLEYGTDKWKKKAADILSILPSFELTDYTIRIFWSEDSVVKIENGKIKGEGYPFS